MKQLSILAMVLAATVAFSAHAVAADTLMGDPKKDSSSVRRMCSARSVEAKKAVLAREAGVPLEEAKRKSALPVYVLRNIYDQTTMSSAAQVAYTGWACIAESRYIAPSLGPLMVDDFSQCETAMRAGADKGCWDAIRKRVLDEQDMPPPEVSIMVGGVDVANEPAEPDPAAANDRALPSLPVAMGKAMLKRLESQCELYPTMNHYQRLRELLATPRSKSHDYEFSFQMVFDASIWVEYAEPTSCKQSILQNMNDGIGFYLQNGPEHGYYKPDLIKELAYVRYAVPVLSGSQDYLTSFNEANALVKQYVALSSKQKHELYNSEMGLFDQVLKLKLSTEQRKLVLTHAIAALEFRKQSAKKPMTMNGDLDKLRRELQALGSNS